MSDERLIDNVNHELASHLDSPVADRSSLQASQALMGLYETQMPTNQNRVSLTPNRHNHLNGGCVDDATDIGQAHQSVSDDTSEDKEDAGTVDGTENPECESVRSDDSECLPVGWMTSTLKDMEEENAKVVKELNKQIDSLKKKNERLTESIGSIKGEVKSLKKNNSSLLKENTKLTSSDASTVERYKSLLREKENQAKDALKHKRTIEVQYNSLQKDYNKKDKDLVQARIQIKELDSNLSLEKRFHKNEVDTIKKHNMNN